MDAGSSAVRFPSLRKPRARLDRLRSHHLSIAAGIIKADERLWTIDMVMLSMLQRSYGLVDGLIDAVDRFNIYVAPPLLRMQIDTLVRAHYIATCGNGEEVCRRLLAGDQFRNMKDGNGKPLSDAHLMRLASEAHGWAKEVYQRTSGWVHLSEEHIRAGWQLKDPNERTMTLRVPASEEAIPESMWLEILMAMTRATEELFGWAESWTANKGLPPGVERTL